MLKSWLFCYRRKNVIYAVQGECDLLYIKSEAYGATKMTIIGDGHVGIWARHDMSRHVTTCRVVSCVVTGQVEFELNCVRPDLSLGESRNVFRGFYFLIFYSRYAWESVSDRFPNLCKCTGWPKNVSHHQFFKKSYWRLPTRVDFFVN